MKIKNLRFREEGQGFLKYDMNCIVILGRFSFELNGKKVIIYTVEQYSDCFIIENNRYGINDITESELLKQEYDAFIFRLFKEGNKDNLEIDIPKLIIERI